MSCMESTRPQRNMIGLIPSKTSTVGYKLGILYFLYLRNIQPAELVKPPNQHTLIEFLALPDQLNQLFDWNENGRRERADQAVRTGVEVG